MHSLNCLAEDGKQVQALLSFMVTKQNYFLTHSDTSINKNTSNDRNFIDIDLDMAHSSHMIDCSLEPDSALSWVIKNSAEISMEYGKGTETTFNFAYIEVFL